MTAPEQRIRVLYTGPAASARVAAEALGPGFDVIAVDPTPESLEPVFETCDAMLDASMRVPLGADLIARAGSLRVISTATTGASHIDAAALEARGIPLLTLKGQTEVLRDLTPAAEHSWLLLMACARGLRGALHHVEGGDWDRTRFPGAMLKGSTIGIIGLGRIGGWMARYAAAFDMTVIAHDPFVSEAPDGVRLAELDDLLAIADFVTLHVGLNPETEGMIDRRRIGLMKPGAIFINTSRGELTDEEALVDALREGRLASVGVDVLVGEPEPDASPLWHYAADHSNVIITPHIGGFSPRAVDITVAFAARRIADFFEGS